MGLKCGLVVGTLSWSIVLGVTTKSKLPYPPFFIYRTCAAIVAWLWIWSGLVFIWTKYRINYVFIFEFEPRSRLTFLQYFDEAATLSLILFMDIILYIKTAQLISVSSAMLWPSVLIIFFMLKLFLPIFDHWKSRKCLLDSLVQVVIAPFGRVRFRDFFTGDVLTSFVKVGADFYMALCSLALGEMMLYDENDGKCSRSRPIVAPIVISLPYWWRFCQCLNRYFVTGDRLPHLANAVKYGMAMTVTLLATLHAKYSEFDADHDEWTVSRILWLSITMLSTSYLYFWDVRKDWNLFSNVLYCEIPDDIERERQKDNYSKFFGRVLDYPFPWYVIAMIIDINLRFLWTFTLFPTTANPYFSTEINPSYFLLFIEIAELCRRGSWAIFRVERSHVSRKDEFRSYEYVPLFYEHTTLVEQQQQQNKPASMLMEILAIFILVVIVVIILIATD